MIPGLELIPEVVSSEEEMAAISAVESLPGDWERPILRPGLPAARREMLCFGWDYVTAGRTLRPGAPLPPLLLDVRARCAAAAGVAADDLVQGIVTRYPTRAGINWHTDAAVFGPTVLTLSLATDWRMDFKPRGGTAVTRVALPRRSLLVLSGPARAGWLHRVPPVKALRISISFRSLAA